jgi:hypothetical protein
VEKAAKLFRHDYRVFEVQQTTGAQFEVTLISNPEAASDRRRPDRISTGTCMGSVRLVVDMAHMDTFAKGKHFTVVLEEKVTA